MYAIRSYYDPVIDEVVDLADDLLFGERIVPEPEGKECVLPGGIPEGLEPFLVGGFAIVLRGRESRVASYVVRRR